MDSKMVLNSENELRETIHQQPKLQKWIALILSYIFHPVFVPIYLLYFLLFVEPFLFAYLPLSSEQEVIGFKMRVLMQGIINYTFFPIVTILLLKGVGFIKSIKLKERKDRIIPFIVCNIWYFWIWYVWRGLEGIPRELVLYAMAVFMASSIGLLLNIYMKVSMHAIALGTTTAFLCLLGFLYGPGMTLYIAIALLITGAVCTARLLLSDHDSREVFWGLAAGVIAVVIANIVV